MQKNSFNLLFILALLEEGIKFFFSPPLYNCWELDSPLQCSATHSPLSQPQQIISTLCFHPSNPTSCLEMLRSWPNTCHQFHIPIFTQKRECLGLLCFKVNNFHLCSFKVQVALLNLINSSFCQFQNKQFPFWYAFIELDFYFVVF